MITEKVLLELISHEAIVRTAYKDSVGVWTWSVGITSASGHKVERYINNEQTMERCLEVFIWAVEKYAKDVLAAFPSITLTESQFAAALSFHYNTGAIKRASWVKSFNAGKIADAKKQFMDWSKPSEIIPRRTKERDLFFDGKWSSDGRVTEYKTYANGNVNWSSAKRVDIREDLRRAMKQDPIKEVPKEDETQADVPWYISVLNAFISLFVKRKE